MKHKKIFVAVATTTLVGVSSPAIAATLHNGSGASCDGLGVFHFVNNQTGTLIDAETNLDGRLVLSDFTCEDDSEKK